MKTKFLILITLAFIGLSNLNAQVGIGTTTPKGALDVVSDDSGIIVPRVANTAAVSSPVNGMIIYDVSSTCFKVYEHDSWSDCVNPKAASISSLDNCDEPALVGSFTAGQPPTSGVLALINYSGGNGGAYSGQTVTSTGTVNDLTANLEPQTLSNGSGGTLTYKITSSDSTNVAGKANFAIDLGGESCTFSINVQFNPPTSCAGITAPSGFGLITAGNLCWLDRNLGAGQVAGSSQDAASYGDLYQWGRLADGHEKINRSVTPNVPVNGTTTTISTTDVPGNNLFITTSGNNNDDWRQGGNDNLWQGDGATNDPCPDGFRVPTATELSSLGLSDASDAFTTLKLPVAGRRIDNTGTLFGVGSTGYLWSGTVSGNRARFLDFDSGDSGISFLARAGGLSVRCLKD